MTAHQIVLKRIRLQIDHDDLMEEYAKAEQKRDGLKMRFLDYRLRNNRKDMEELCESAHVDTAQTTT